MKNSKRQGRPKGAPDYDFKSLHLGMDARNAPLPELKRLHKWLGRYLAYWAPASKKESPK